MVILPWSTFFVVDAFSPFTCKGTPRWPLNLDDNEEMMARFQNMLRYYQNRCTPSFNKYEYSTEITRGGIGFTSAFSAINLLKAFELGHIYRPNGVWIWSDSNCFSKSSSIDCFNIPLSYCLLSPIPPSERINKTDALKLIPRPCDVCTLGLKSKKSILWVYGQLIHYQLRLPPAMEQKVLENVAKIFPVKRAASHVDKTKVRYGEHEIHNTSVVPIDDVFKYHYPLEKGKIDPKTGLHCLTAAIQVRGGNPDIHRKPLNGTEHLKILLEYNERLKHHNFAICEVYVGADHIEETIFYPKSFPKGNVGNFTIPFHYQHGPFVFKSLPRYISAPGEIEYQVPAIKKSGNVTMQLLYQEFMEDVWLYTHSDILLASLSNLYRIAASLRQAYYPRLFNNVTCCVNSKTVPISLSCANSKESNELFSKLYGGFDGGVPFFDEN